MTRSTGPNDHKVAATARWALVTSLRGLALTDLAAAGSTSLALRAALLLITLDGIALRSAWLIAERRRHGARRACLARAEVQVMALVALCASVSMLVVAGEALAQLAAGEAAPEGAGLWIGLALNLSSGAVNSWLLALWRARDHAASSAPTRSQMYLFSDKLCSNVLLAGSLALKPASATFRPRRGDGLLDLAGGQAAGPAGQ